MRKWLPLGALALVLLWSPFLYRELSREPEGSDANGDEDAVWMDGPPRSVSDPPGVVPKALTALPERGRTPEAPAPEAPAPEAPAPETDPPTEPEAPPAADNTAPPEAPPTADDTAAPQVTSQGPAAVLREAFESQTRDALWARDHEALLLSAAAEHGFEGLTDKDVMCRRSLCRMAIDMAADRSRSLTQLRAYLEEGVSPILAVDLVSRNADRVSVFLYVTREGYTLADFEP